MARDVKVLFRVSYRQRQMPRAYEMRARAESTSRTREAILVAVDHLSSERLPMQISLADVAERAGTSVQTVLRHFGSKDALLEAAWARMIEDVRAEREAPVGDVAAAVRAVVTSYERLGDWSVRMQAQESSDDTARHVVAVGRRFHRRWVSEVFAPSLTDRADAAELLDLLVVATDLLTWKNLRRDLGLSRAATVARMQRLVEAVLASAA
jgi:AcrR family transcriptional regulator